MKTLRYFSSIFSLITSSVIGSILGVMTSLMVNCTLLEISMNNIFSIVSFYLNYSRVLWNDIDNNRINNIMEKFNV